MLYTAKYEVSKGDRVQSSEMTIEAVSEERAREYAEAKLEERFPGDQDWILLELDVEPRMGRPSQGRSERLQSMITPDLKEWLEAQKSQGETMSDVVFRLFSELMSK